MDELAAPTASGAGWLGRIGRLVLAASALVALFYFRVVDLGSLVQLLSDPIAILLALGCILLALHLAIIRWNLLLRAQDIHIRFGTLWQLAFMANFANGFLPGGVGGDALRMYYIRGLAPGQSGHAVISIVADRFIGLAGLMLAGVVVIVAYLGRISRSVALEQLAWMVALVTGAGTLLFIFAFFLGYHPSFRMRLRALTSRHNFFGRMGRLLIDVARDYHRAVGAVLVCVLLSVVAQGLTIVALVTLVRALAPAPIEWGTTALAGVLSSLANTIPLTPGGIGIGEGVFDQICRLLSTAQPEVSYGSAFFAMRAVSYAATSPGLACFVSYRAPRASRPYAEQAGTE